jgi:hypothetical protein
MHLTIHYKKIKFRKIILMTIGRIIEPNEAANNKPKNGNSYQTVG